MPVGFELARPRCLAPLAALGLERGERGGQERGEWEDREGYVWCGVVCMVPPPGLGDMRQASVKQAIQRADRSKRTNELHQE